jgi:S-DNA-T family DNA segregation ATPase FtsK/SpoIIIE
MPVQLNGHTRDAAPPLRLVPPPQDDTPPTDPTPAAPTAPPRPASAPFPTLVRTRVRQGAAGVRTVATHRTTRFALRQGAYVIGGGRVVARRTLDARTTARHQRMMRLAEATGDHEGMREWADRAEASRKARHERRVALLHAPILLAKGALWSAGAMLALGIVLAITTKDHNPLRPFIDALNAARDLYAFGLLVWHLASRFGPWVALAALWGVGRAKTEPPTWVMPAQGAGTQGAPVTPSAVVTALRDLGNAKLAKFIKEADDAAAGMLSAIRIAGCGVEVDVTLPSGVTTVDIQRQRRRLAENLNRHEHELYITIPQAARTVRLWIADSGALDEPIGPSPLVLDPTLSADYYTGRAPWGQNLRGDAALISLFQRHMLITGLSNQGKTAALRALALWVLLDPTVEVWCADLKGVGDWSMLRDLATRLVVGPTDQHVIDTTHMAEAAVVEMERRLAAVEASGSTEGVTRQMARKPGSGLHPLILIVDEAQVAYMCPAVGEDKRPYGGAKTTSRYLQAVRKIHNQGRAVNVLIWEGTQDPTTQNLPILSREGNHTRAALALGTEEQSGMALGDKAVNGGAAPHLLRQGLDKGTVVVASDGVDLPRGESFITIRTHYVNGDQATTLADRARDMRRGQTRETTVQQAPARDFPADVATVLGTARRIRTTELLRALINLDRAAYGTWTQQTLTARLTEIGAAPHKYNGHPVADAQKISDAITRREP